MVPASDSPRASENLLKDTGTTHFDTRHIRTTTTQLPHCTGTTACTLPSSSAVSSRSPFLRAVSCRPRAAPAVASLVLFALLSSLPLLDAHHSPPQSTVAHPPTAASHTASGLFRNKSPSSPPPPHCRLHSNPIVTSSSRHGPAAPGDAKRGFRRSRPKTTHWGPATTQDRWGQQEPFALLSFLTDVSI